MTRSFLLYGTNQPKEPSRTLEFGPWSAELVAGGIRHINLNGVEAIRGISFLARDRDWGTLVPTISGESEVSEVGKLGISFNALYENGTSSISVGVEILMNADTLIVSAKGLATGDFETNRVGFTVLHPIEGVAGHSVRVGHSDGTFEDSVFPDLIEPWQPFMDITSIVHRTGVTLVTCAFEGDTFEMEDQRQWGDASYKTYNRPLAKPWPYVIHDKEEVSQSVRLSWTPAGNGQAPQSPVSEKETTFPELALVMTPADAEQLVERPEDLEMVNPQRLLCHFDTTVGDLEDQLNAFAHAQSVCTDKIYDLELICSCSEEPLTEMQKIAALLQSSGFQPDSVLVCPSVDRQSTPPGSDWPECPSLDVIHEASSSAFPNILRGGGMVSFFPELNRKRPPVEKLDFVSHGLCPIVHAADDISVMETLEAIPHITRSAEKIIGDRSYRIGPATIAMRQNPYGERTIPNPKNERVCMADSDPRHRARFGAAYAIGLATALGSSGAEVWTPAALYGPRGVVADEGVWPITSALRVLATCSGKPVKKAKIEGGLASLIVGGLEISANLSSQETDALGPFEWRAI